MAELPELIDGEGAADVDLSFVSEFLASIDQTDAASSFGSAAPSGRSARRRASVASSARRQRARGKKERLELHEQVATLGRHLQLLRDEHKKSRGDCSVAEWEERAVMQRRKRQQAEQTNQQLKRAIIAQRGFLRGFRHVASAASEHSDELSMSALLHTYTRLRKDPRSRLQDFQGLCTDQKLDLATQIVMQETSGISVDSPTFISRRVRAQADEFSATTTAVYSMDELDVGETFSVACSAILSYGPDWTDYQLLESQWNSVDSPVTHVRYNLSGVQYRDPKENIITLEGRGISYYLIIDQFAVLVWDYVDADELFPLQEETDAKRDVIGAMVVRRELCSDGIPRVICRTICTKILRFSSCKNFKVSQDIIDAPQKTILGMRSCTSRVYNTIKESQRGQQLVSRVGAS